MVSNNNKIAVRKVQYDRTVSRNEFQQKPVGVACELRLISVNDVNEVFTVAVMVHCHYTISELQPDPSAPDAFIRDSSYSGFVPAIEFINTVDQQFMDFEIVTRINARRGIVWTSFKNTFQINESLELEKFPYDRQLFRVQFKSADSALDVWSIDTDILDYPESSRPEDENAPYLVSCELNTWKCVGIEVGVHSEDPDPVSLTASEFCITIRAEREPMFYLKNYTFVVFLIVISNVACVAFPPFDTSSRMEISMTLLLTAVANKFVLSNALPKLGYATFMDKQMQLAFVVLMFGILENIAISQRVLCLGEALTNGAHMECMEDLTLDVTKQNKVATFDAYFQVAYGLCLVSGFFFLWFISLFPKLMQDSWAFVDDNQIGDIENHIKRTALCKDLDGEYEGQYRRGTVGGATEL